MRRLILPILLCIPFFSFSQNGITINYVLNNQDKEVAKRIQSPSKTSWIISDSTATFESLYQELQRLEMKYKLALSILKLLDINGVATDKKRYNEEVTAFNNFKK